MKKILVIEDDESIRKPLADHLAREGYQVLTSATGSDADAKISENPDLIIVDWMLPDTQGIECIKKFRAKGVSAPIIMLTARADLVDKVLGLELGANDYITKPFELRELIARVRAQLRAHDSRSSAAPANERVEAAGIVLSVSTRTVQFRGKCVDLTKTEFELLRLLIENPNQVFSREELLKKVWGYDSYPTTRTVDTHVLQLRHKFVSEYFETVHGIGYRFRATAEQIYDK
jgi:DNA-binding response OmpR family regulator